MQNIDVNIEFIQLIHREDDPILFQNTQLIKLLEIKVHRKLKRIFNPTEMTHYLNSVVSSRWGGGCPIYF